MHDQKQAGKRIAENKYFTDSCKSLHEHKLKIQQIKSKQKDAVDNFLATKYTPKSVGPNSHRGKTLLDIKNDIELDLERQKTQIDSLKDEILRLYQLQSL